MPCIFNAGSFFLKMEKGVGTFRQAFSKWKKASGSSGEHFPNGKSVSGKSGEHFPNGKSVSGRSVDLLGFPKTLSECSDDLLGFLNEMYLDKEKYFLLYFKQNEMKFFQERFIMRKLLLLWAAALCFLLFSCSKATISDVKNSDEAEGYISEISPTLIARTDSIFIRFTKDITELG